MSTTPSFWLDQLGSRPSRPALAGDREADVCIIGGGFTGLWTKYQLQRADPEPASSRCWRHSRWGSGRRDATAGGCWASCRGTADAWRARGGAGWPAGDGPGHAADRRGDRRRRGRGEHRVRLEARRDRDRGPGASDTQLTRLRELVDAERRDLGEGPGVAAAGRRRDGGRRSTSTGCVAGLHAALRAGAAGTAGRRPGGGAIRGRWRRRCRRSSASSSCCVEVRSARGGPTRRLGVLMRTPETTAIWFVDGSTRTGSP